MQTKINIVDLIFLIIWFNSFEYSPKVFIITLSLLIILIPLILIQKYLYND